MKTLDRTNTLVSFEKFTSFKDLEDKVGVYQTQADFQIPVQEWQLFTEFGLS